MDALEKVTIFKFVSADECKIIQTQYSIVRNFLFRVYEFIHDDH